jgi:preprotein translocase subunit SecA
MFNFFGQETFEHSQNVRRSAYLLINRQNQPIDDFKNRAEEMFQKMYLNLEEQALP